MSFKRAVGLEDIPRAKAEIRRTIKGLRDRQFKQDPLFDAGESFGWSVRSSVVKREGLIIQAAIMDAIAQTSHLRLMDKIQLPKRSVDVCFAQSRTFVALEIKRGSDHDSTKQRAFDRDLKELPALIKSVMPSYKIAYHIVFIDGEPPIEEGLKPSSLKEIYQLDIVPYITSARQCYCPEFRMILQERGL